MIEKSDVGHVIDGVLVRRSERDGVQVSFLSGWTQCAAMPSLEDFDRAYSGADLIIGGEVLFLSEVAAKTSGYRGTLTFTDDEHAYCGIVFFAPHGSFFFVFGIDAVRTVRLYYMGVESRAVDRCSEIAAAFDFNFEDAYCDLRDEIRGKFGIPKGGGSS